MPSKTQKQANAAKLAGAVKAGKFPQSKAGPAVKAMAKMPMKKLKHFMKVKECMTMEQKKRLLIALKALREEVTGNVGGETDIANADNLVSEEETERNVVAKTFDTQSDFDSYVNQHRGIEMTAKEQQAVLGYKNAKPTQQDKFFVKYETTDGFGNNTTTVIKKLREGNQFCFTAFSKHETAEEEGQPEGGSEGGSEESEKEEPSLKEFAPPQPAKPAHPAPSNPPQQAQQQTPEDDEVTVNDPIRITKTITFLSDVEGANILGDFLRKLDI